MPLSMLTSEMELILLRSCLTKKATKKARRGLQPITNRQRYGYGVGLIKKTYR